MNSETQVLVKEEVEKMHKSGIIRVAKYNQWLSNIVSVRKKNGKMRVCVDYRDLNLATSKDVYPMPVADMLIPVAEEDRHKTAFWCPGFAGVFEYMVMPFGLKNAGTTYQIAMNLIFHDILGKILEVYIDDAGDFLGFIVHQLGIEVPEDKASAVINTSPPQTKKELQRLLGKIQPFTPLLRLQGQNEFVWEPKHQEAFDSIKAYLASPPVLVLSRAGIPLKLYISAAEACIGKLLAQYDEGGIEHAIFYLSRTLTDYETRKLSRGRPSRIFLRIIPATLEIPTLKKLEIASATMIRLDLECILEYAVWYQATVSLQPWVLFFDGSRTDTLAGAGIVLENPTGDRFSYSFQLEFKCTNNQAEYEALIIGLEVLLEMGVRDVQIRGDSQLVINQLQEKYRCLSWLLIPYLNRAIELLDQFDDVGLEYIPRERNFAANELAQLATGVTLKYEVRERILKVERRTLPSWLDRPDPPDDPVIAVLEPIDVDWRIPLVEYLKQPDATADKKICFLALNYFLRGDELRRHGEDGIDFRCVYGREAKRLMREIHTGICGAHQAVPKMRWLLRRHGYYWPSILKDCIAFAKGCEDCQAHRPVQHVPTIPMQPIIKPWPA
ncbi:uncharacterized protein LOC112185255 [Rosa chinensis]|uniref:uncharacterized protein LOC112185255 n=1 Tax=Rosa chinensis TaxID=74649 RepID=UPI000D08B547|nr:uncharacterized protein LOC112185255 [Rosa chinensis]